MSLRGSSAIPADARDHHAEQVRDEALSVEQLAALRLLGYEYLPETRGHFASVYRTDAAGERVACRKNNVWSFTDTAEAAVIGVIRGD